MASNDGSKTTTVDIEKMRVSDRQIDNNLREGVGALASTSKDKDGQERFWGFKVSKTAAFAINSLYDNFILPFTKEGSKQIYNAVYKIAEKSEHTTGRAHEIAGAIALAARVGAVIAKPAAEFISINKEHYGERNELYEKVKDAIEGTPADYSKNEVIKTAFERVDGRWSRDVVRKLPDIAKTAIQAGMAYSDHRDEMAKKPGALKVATTPSADPTKPPVDTTKEDFFKRIKEMREGGADPEAIQFEVEEFKRSRGMVKNEEQSQLGIFTPNAAGALGFGSELLKVGVDEYTAGKLPSTATAWDKIQLLKTFMAEQPAGQDPDRIRVNGMPLKKFIIDVFQQNEIDRGRGRMGDALIEQLMPAVNKIADGIASTTIDPNALVHLVGDNKIIKIEGGARIFANEESVEEALSQIRGVNTAKEHINRDEFFSNFADPAMARGSVKTTIAALEGLPKAVYIASMPDEILADAGLGKEAIIEFRKQAKEGLYDIVAAEVIEKSEKSPDELKALGLTKAQIEAVQQLAKEVKHGNMEAVHNAVDGADRTVVSAVRTAAMHDQMEAKDTSGKVWTDLVSKGASFHEKVESGEFAAKTKPTSFAERERKPEHQHGTHAAHHQKTNPNATAAEREAHRRNGHGQEPHEGIGAR